MELKHLWPILIAAFLGWILAIVTNWISFKITRRTEKRDVARILLSEVKFNDRRAKAFASLHEDISSEQELKDEQGNQVTLDLSQAKIPPDSFSFSIFDATLQRHAHFDHDLIDALHTFYRMLRQAEQFREAAANDSAPQRRAGFLKHALWSMAEAAKVVQDRQLMQRLEKTSK
jgi:hypothetical protein